ncbi:hypothetical protein [Streptomyces resistomycificus]|uniref:Secreted protein n=1 Tax=Streptomyces resistomycificus TaxID=67356 RepID=A0A0L8LZV0_9ACTN|nr:hypothetical protein [Streptomyces resistomycificus]KOG43610.1 hypothetical protein ADK37_00270 [Streptomyces resistomycificus]KUO00182.1 hypothetical protein AQJ84_08645 [Streptomyces resistomycificus]
MHTHQLLLRSGLTVAAAALPLTLTAMPAAAVSGISVSTTGSTVSVTTSACTQVNGSWGTASLLNSSQANFSQGRQVALSGASNLQSAAWSSVSAGTYTVIVMCSNGTTAGTQSVIVTPVSTPTASPTASPSRGVMGGLGGASKDYGTLTLAVGGSLVGAGVLATAWFLRRRSKPYRL